MKVRSPGSLLLLLQAANPNCRALTAIATVHENDGGRGQERETDREGKREREIESSRVRGGGRGRGRWGMRLN
jgi:hypothetical protein